MPSQTPNDLPPLEPTRATKALAEAFKIRMLDDMPQMPRGMPNVDFSATITLEGNGRMIVSVVGPDNTWYVFMGTVPDAWPAMPPCSAFYRPKTQYGIAKLYYSNFFRLWSNDEGHIVLVFYDGDLLFSYNALLPGSTPLRWDGMGLTVKRPLFDMFSGQSRPPPNGGPNLQRR